MLAWRISRTAGNSRGDHVRGAVGAAAVDDRDPHLLAGRRVRGQRAQAAPQQRFGAVADDDDLEVGRGHRLLR